MKIVSMNNLDEKINRILVQWNPLDVPSAISIHEYDSYVPLIKSNLRSKEDLMYCLNRIAYGEMELEPTEVLEDEIKRICSELFEMEKE